MSLPADLLDEPAGADGWLDRVGASLASDPGAWTALAWDDGLTRDRSWRLLNWPEGMLARVVREGRADVVAHAAFAMALLEASPLDRRDVQVVGALLHHVADLAHVDWPAAVTAGCTAAGDLGDAARPWLLQTPSHVPATHEETGAGPTYEIRRRKVDFDENELLARLNRHRKS